MTKKFIVDEISPFLPLKNPFNFTQHTLTMVFMYKSLLYKNTSCIYPKIVLSPEETEFVRIYTFFDTQLEIAESERDNDSIQIEIQRLEHLTPALIKINEEKSRRFFPRSFCF